MSNLDTLVQRFLDDQSELSADELDELIAGLKAEPARAVALRQQLMVDDLLAQKLTVDRRNFRAQVEQRIADHERNEQEIDSHVVGLQEMAAAESERPAGRPNRVWVQGVLAASILAIAVSAWLVPRFLPRPEIAVAKVRDMQGAVTSTRNSRDEPLTAQGTLFAGQVIDTPADGMLELEYADKSIVRIGGDSLLTVESDPTSGAKRLRLDRGQVWADVARQTVGAMQIVTPHAVATVLGTQFRLSVSENDTLLEVMKGKVQLASLGPQPPIVVAADESGLATLDGALDFRAVHWPENPDALAFALDPFTRVGGRFWSSESESVFQAEFAGQGSAALDEFSGAIDLAGGWLVEAEGGRDVTAHVREAGEFTLEIVLAPAQKQLADRATIVSLASEGQAANFELTQEKDEFVFVLQTDGESGKEESVGIPLGTSAGGTPAPRYLAGGTPAPRPVHLTITFADGELIAYRDGRKVASAESGGSLAAWTSGFLTIGADVAGKSPWHGMIEAIAVYHRPLDAGEVAQNVQNFRTLARRP